MIEAQNWLAPLLGTLVLLLIGGAVAGMANTVVRRLRQDDLRVHERRLAQSAVRSRRDEEKEREKALGQWALIDKYSRARNLALVACLALVGLNLSIMALGLLGPGPLLPLLAITVIAAGLAYALWRALKKPVRPEWVVSPGYYRDRLLGQRGRGE